MNGPEQKNWPQSFSAPGTHYRIRKVPPVAAWVPCGRTTHVALRPEPRHMTEAAVEPLAAAPYTTCGGGVVLEHRYGATLLASFLARTPVPELGDDVTPTVVRLQVSDFSPVDDLVVSGPAPDGGPRDGAIGVGRALQLVRSKKESVSLVRSSRRVVTRSWDEILAGRWRLVLAVADKNSAVEDPGRPGGAAG